jgi:hypothetical protein
MVADVARIAGAFALDERELAARRSAGLRIQIRQLIDVTRIDDLHGFTFSTRSNDIPSESVAGRNPERCFTSAQPGGSAAFTAAL